MKKLILILSLISSFSLAFSQTKFEREYSINYEDVPEKAKDFINKAFNNNKIKWYKEVSQDGISLEAKTKFQKHYFSIEFDTLGNIQDVEKKVKFKKLSKDTQELIKNSIESVFDKYRINKIQIHWKSDDNTLIELINSKINNKEFTISYEIVIESKSEQGPKLYELLISDTGNIIRKSKIEQRSYDNLEF